MDFTSDYLSPLGQIVLAADESGTALTGLWFEGQKYFAAALSPEHERRSLPVFDRCAAWLDLYFSGAVPDFTPPLALRGTPFRRRVWNALLAIPYGETVSYGELARMLGSGTASADGGTNAASSVDVSTVDASTVSARAVGSAVGHNPVSLIVPCHRVTGADGSLTGYAGGIGRKLRLLELEKGVLC